MNIFEIIVMFILWLVVIPFLMGIVPGFLFEKQKKRIGTIYLAGWIFMAAIFQLVSVPLVLKMKTFSQLEELYTIIILIIVIASCFVMIVTVGISALIDFVELPSFKKMTRQEVILWGIFGLLLTLQVVMSIAWMTPDGDDSYYVTNSVIADEEDKMYIEDPYTGVYCNLEYRHVLAPFSMFVSFFARKLSVHATIVAHSILPAVFIMLTYLVYYKICQALLPNENEKQSVFMILISGMQLFGGTSRFTNEMFFLTRTWQGKSFLANMIIPFIFYMLLQLCRQTEKEGNHRYRLLGIYFLIFAGNLAGALSSSLGLLLLMIFEGVWYVIIAIRNRQKAMIPCGGITLLPCVVYMALYIFMK